MHIKQILKINKKYNLSHDELTSCILYLATDNKIWSWQQGEGRNSNAKTTSTATISTKFYVNTKIASFLFDAKGVLNKDIENVADKIDCECEGAETKKQGSENVTEKRKYKTLRADMTQEELVDFFNDELQNITDPNKRADFNIKIMDKLKLNDASVSDEDGNKVLTYLPERCEACKYKQSVTGKNNA